MSTTRDIGLIAYAGPIDDVRKRTSFDEILDANEAAALALFVKRVHFDDCLRKTDAGYPEATRTDQAYLMISALETVRRVLAKQGLCPR